MKEGHIIRRFVLAPIVALTMAAAVFAQAQAPAKPFEPTVGQPGKDVVWVPTPQALVDKMLDMAAVTPRDYLIDLGSGDGRTVITAAKRGLKAHGIEYNPDMVALSQQNAVKEGVTARATFAKADIFESDYSQATVITMFLLPSLNMQLRPTLLKLKPGTRLVSNMFRMEEWMPDQTETIPNCEQWCTALLWIVPANAEGTWRMAQGELALKQSFQMLSGTLTVNGAATPISDGRLRGADVSFTAGAAKYTGKVNGNTMEGTVTGGSGGSWRATRAGA